MAPSALAPMYGLGWATISLCTHLLLLCGNTLEVSAVEQQLIGRASELHKPGGMVLTCNSSTAKGKMEAGRGNQMFKVISATSEFEASVGYMRLCTAPFLSSKE